MTDQTEGRVVVITGANEGIGYHLLAALIDEGYRVAALDVDGENVAALRDDAAEWVRYYECDVGRDDDVTGAIDGVVDDWGRIDVLVNNAAVSEVGPYADGSIDDVRRVFEVNYFGYLRTIRAVLPHMRSQERGIVHNVSSGTAFLGHPGLAGYASTKGAIDSFVRSLRLELHDEPVACTLMYPPSTATRMTAPFDYPDWMLNDPADVGRKLAGKIESTASVIYPDWQTKLGLALMKRVPSLWRRAMDRSVRPDA